MPCLSLSKRTPTPSARPLETLHPRLCLPLAAAEPAAVCRALPEHTHTIQPPLKPPHLPLLWLLQNPLQFAVPGGLIGVGTTVDPTLTRADRLVGQVGWRWKSVATALCGWL